MNSKKNILASVIGFIFGASGAQGVVANEEESAVIESNKALLEEIVVTAEKRAESADDIPIAISAFSNRTLSEAGVFNIRELQQKVPSLQIGADGNQAFVTLRGVGSEVFEIGSEPGVTISQDGVPLLHNVLFDADFLDVERVEVLRGPQGTISGRNATGGGIQIYSALPTENLEGSLKFTAGNYNRTAAEGHISGPIADSNILGRFALSVDKADGWLRNTFLGEDLNDRDKIHARASLTTDLSDSLTGLLIVHALRDNSTHQGDFSFGRIREDTPSLGEYFNVPELDEDRLTVEADTPHISRKKQNGVVAKLTWDVNSSMTLTSTTAYVDMFLRRSYDCDGIRLNLCSLPHLDHDLAQFTQELTLTADLSNNLDLILGGLYLDDHAEDFGEFASADPAGYNLPRGDFVNLAEQDLKSYSGYGQLRYQITDTVRIAIGGRYTYDEKEYVQSGTSLLGDLKESWGAFTPRIAVDYAPAADLLLFASASRGFKAGGINTFSSPINEFDPEFLWSYEVGIKSRLLDNRVRVAGSLFYMDYTNLQQNVFGFDDDGDGVSLPKILNSGEAGIKGVEMEVEALVTDRWHVNLAATWLDATFTDLKTADPIFSELGEPEPTTGYNIRDLSGNRLPRAPEWQINISSKYTAPLTESLSGTLRLDYTWRSEVDFHIFNYPLGRQEEYGLLNFYASILQDTQNGSWTLSAYAQNVLDERYHHTVIVSGIGWAPVPAGTRPLGSPRTYGLSIAWNF